MTDLKMNVNQLRNSNLLTAEILAGSHLYGLNIPTSDFDYRGIFTLPTKEILRFNHNDMITDLKQDIVFYEIGKFLKLAAGANPNILELLYAPDHKIVSSTPLYDLLRENRDLFLTQLCAKTFTGYAISQIKKAKGLNKKMFNPQPKERKTVLDFCYMIRDGKSYPLKKHLKRPQKYYGVVSNQNGKGLYCLYEPFEGARGIMNEDQNSNGIRLSSVPIGVLPLCDFWYNEDGYSVHCKQHKEYWKWVEERNPARYDENTDAQYDRKNMMHTFRLLHMGMEILRDGEVTVHRPDREFLMEIRQGQRDYADLIEKADILIKDLDSFKDKCKLPKQVDMEKVNKLLVEIRLNNM